MRDTVLQTIAMISSSINVLQRYNYSQLCLIDPWRGIQQAMSRLQPIRGLFRITETITNSLCTMERAPTAKKGRRQIKQCQKKFSNFARQLKA